MVARGLFDHVSTRVLLGALLALVVVLGAIFGALAWLSRGDTDVHTTDTRVYTEEEKLQVLAGLRASSDASKTERQGVTDTLKSDTMPSEEDKLEILRKLRTR